MRCVEGSCLADRVAVANEVGAVEAVRALRVARELHQVVLGLQEADEGLLGIGDDTLLVVGTAEILILEVMPQFEGRHDQWLDVEQEEIDFVGHPRSGIALELVAKNLHAGLVPIADEAIEAVSDLGDTDIEEVVGRGLAVTIEAVDTGTAARPIPDQLFGREPLQNTRAGLADWPVPHPDIFVTSLYPKGLCFQFLDGRQVADADLHGVTEIIADREVEGYDIGVGVYDEVQVFGFSATANHVEVALPEQRLDLRVILKPNCLLIGDRRIDGFQEGDLRFRTGSARDHDQRP